MIEHAIVTGGAGFIGASLASALIDAGAHVNVVDRVPRCDALRLTPYQRHPRLRYEQCDLTNPQTRDDLEKLIAGVDTVFHLSGNTENRSAHAAKHADLTLTVAGTVRLLDAIVASGASPKVVFTSSQLVYGPRSTSSHTAKIAVQPRSLFGAGKVAAEAFVSAYAYEFGLSARLCRLANIIGPGFKRGIVYDFVRRLIEDSSSLVVLGDGRQRRSYLTVEDCARGLMMAATEDWAFSQEPVAVLDVSNVDDISALEVAEIVAGQCPAGDTRISTKDSPTGWRGDAGTVLVRPTRLSSLGWRPELPSAAAVRETACQLFADITKEDFRHGHSGQGI